MKLHFIAPLLFALFVHVYSTPIAKLEDPTKIAEGIIQEETQGVFKSASSEAALTSAVTTEAPKEASSTSAPTPAAPEKLKETGRQSSDDDDDDDDDDDLDLGIEDDDDDDAADDDDEDDDYFERFFDDLLGEEDDDDDDSSPSTGSQQPVVVAAEPPEAPASNPQEELQSAGEEAIDGETENPVDGTESDSDNIVEKDPTDADASEQNSVQEPVVVQPVPAEDEDEDDDDDDDDDEPDLGDLAADDDDDDDDEDDETADDDDEDDDDDDEADLEDVLEAKRSRAMQQTGPKMPPVYISKYNRFVDSIINRINRILGKSYDPVRVKIHSSTTKKNKTKSSSKKNKNKTKRTKTKATTKSTGNVAASTTSAPTNKIGEISLARMTESESREPAFVLVSKTSSRKPSMPNETTATTTKKTRRKSNKGKAEKKSTKPRATLFGLSSIKRDGDVSVNMMADHTTVKTNFLVGPLTLRVEREFGKGARKELKSATATTAQMHGKLSLKIKQGGIATLHSLKVMQPKQVRVESPDNHEKTKEYMWKKSGNIATVVAQKLASATRSMLQPPPAA